MSEEENSLPVQEPEVAEAPVQDAQASSEPEQVEAPKVHPAYEKLLAELPSAWH
jgi:hypothetical protein